ncbi:MAG TPA: hypothetical protein VFP20_05575 [Bacteroidales bacterium]|nr:hypothetical protein [Bacteroidales bacterium]
MDKGVVIVSDDLIFYKLFETPLLRKIPDLLLFSCKTYQDIDSMFPDTNIQLILLDDFKASISSIEIIRYLRTKVQTVAPIWFFPEIKTKSYAYKSHEMGASILIYRPFDPFKVANEIAAIINR